MGYGLYSVPQTLSALLLSQENQYRRQTHWLRRGSSIYCIMPRLWINVTATASCNKVIETVASLVKQYNKGEPKIELIRVRHETDWDIVWSNIPTAFKKVQGLLEFTSLNLAPEPLNEQWQVCIDQAPEDAVEVDLIRCLHSKYIDQSEYDLLKHINHLNRDKKAAGSNTRIVNVHVPSAEREALHDVLLLDRYLENKRWGQDRININLNDQDQAVGQILEILHQWLQDPKLPNGIKTIDPNGSLTMHPNKNLAIKWTKVGEPYSTTSFFYPEPEKKSPPRSMMLPHETSTAGAADSGVVSGLASSSSSSSSLSLCAGAEAANYQQEGEPLAPYIITPNELIKTGFDIPPSLIPEARQGNHGKPNQLLGAATPRPN